MSGTPVPELRAAVFGAGGGIGAALVAALNMLVANFAIELARTNPLGLAVTLHPGTVATPLSAPFQRGVPEHRLFTPEMSAACLLKVIDGLGQADSGGFFAWDGARIEF